MAAFEALGKVARDNQTDDLLTLDITMQQAKAIHVIASEPGIGVSALAARLRVGASTASGSLDRLVEMGLVDRRHDEQDRRHVVLTLTPEGSAIIERFRDQGVGILREHLAQLHPSELAGLRVGFEGLLRVLSVPAADASPSSSSIDPATDIEGAP